MRKKLMLFLAAVFMLFAGSNGVIGGTLVQEE